MGVVEHHHVWPKRSVDGKEPRPTRLVVQYMLNSKTKLGFSQFGQTVYGSLRKASPRHHDNIPHLFRCRGYIHDWYGASSAGLWRVGKPRKDNHVIIKFAQGFCQTLKS